MGLLARMTQNGKATTGAHPDVLELRLRVTGWQARYKRQLAADAKANKQTLAQLEQGIRARQVARRA